MAANQVLTPSGLVTAKAGARGDQQVSQFLGDYSALAEAGMLYTAYTTAVALSLPATATIGCMVWNPPGSGVRIHLLEWGSQIYATDADCTGVVLAVGYQTTTPTTVTAATFYGRTLVDDIVAKPGKARAYNIATVLTAPLAMYLLHHSTAAINTVGQENMSGSFKGGIVLEEGAFATTAAHGAAAAASGWAGHLLFAEVPKA